MKRMAIAAAVFGALMAGHGTASAQAKAGDKEILVFGNVTTLFGGSTFTHGSVFFNGGQFLTDSFEIGGGPTITAADAARIGRGLNARTVLFGSVRRFGESTYVITTRAVDVETQQIQGSREVTCENCQEQDLPRAVAALRKTIAP